jgi:hypothetical protein
LPFLRGNFLDGFHDSDKNSEPVPASTTYGDGDARKAIHDRELRAGDWKLLNDKIEELSRRLEAIKTLRGLKAAEHARLSRNKRIAPLVKLIDRDRARLAALGPMPNVPVGFGQSLHEKFEAFRKATETRKRIADDEASFARDYAEITVDEPLLERAGDVLRLFGETGAYANNWRDLPRIQVETDEYQAILAELAVRLGHQTVPEPGKTCDLLRREAQRWCRPLPQGGGVGRKVLANQKEQQKGSYRHRHRSLTSLPLPAAEPRN